MFFSPSTVQTSELSSSSSSRRIRSSLKSNALGPRPGKPDRAPRPAGPVGGTRSYRDATEDSGSLRAIALAGPMSYQRGLTISGSAATPPYQKERALPAEARAYDEAVIRPDLEVGKIVMTPATPLVPPSRGLIGKFQHDLDDAVAKRDRQGRPGQLVVFYDWVNADFGVSRRKAHIEVIEWAQQAELSSCVKIVIAWNYNWQAPIYQSPLEEIGSGSGGAS